MDIIEGIVNRNSAAKTKEPSATASPAASHASKAKDRDPKKEKWRSYDESKRKKMYENTVSIYRYLLWSVLADYSSSSHTFSTS